MKKSRLTKPPESILHGSDIYERNSMDKTDRELRRWMRRHERERTRPRRTFWFVVALVVVLAIVFALINRTRIVLFFGF